MTSPWTSDLPVELLVAINEVLCTPTSRWDEVVRATVWLVLDDGSRTSFEFRPNEPIRFPDLSARPVDARLTLYDSAGQVILAAVVMSDGRQFYEGRADA